MFTRFACFCACCLASVSLLVAVTGCSKEEEPKRTAPTADVAKPAKTKYAARQRKIEAKLASADLLDGKADKIVTRCASCGLKMDGSSEHTLKALDYTLYFCTEKCAKGFAENTTESILGLKIPED